MGTDKNKSVGLVKKGFWVILSIIPFLINFEITFSQSDVDEESSDLIYRQDFSEQAPEWEIEPYREDWGTVDYSVTGGMFHCEMNLNQYRWFGVKPIMKINLPKEGYQISLDTKFESACEGCSSGLTFNFQDWDNYYYAELETDGDITVFAIDYDKSIQVSDTVRAQNYNPSGMNKMTVINKGNKFEIRINDMLASRFIDDRFHGGTVGLRAEGIQGTKNIVHFDNLEVRKINLDDFPELDEPEKSSDLIYRQDFSEQAPEWEIEPYREDLGIVDYSVTGGMFHCEMNLNQDSGIVVKPDIRINLPKEGYQISLETRFESACKDCSSGFFFNFQDWENYYYAELKTDSNLSVYAFDNKKWIQVSNTVRAQNYNPSGMNKITVINKGNKFEIRINDMLASRFIDDRFHGGTLVLGVAGSKGTKNIVHFDNLEVRKINPDDFPELDEPEESSDLIYRQDFSEEAPEWEIKPDRKDWGIVDYSVTGGLFQWKMNLNQDIWFGVRPNMNINLPKEGYQISLDTKFESACEGCSSSLIFNFQDWDNYYYAELENDGEIKLFAIDYDKSIQVSDTVRAQNYNPSGMNKMTVINKGNNFEIRINDIPASRFIDDRFHGGTLVLGAGGPKGTKNIVYFDNLEVRKINPDDFPELDEPEESSDLIYRQDFSEQLPGWKTEPIQGGWGTVDYSFTEGMFQWKINTNQFLWFSIMPPIEINLPKEGYQISLETRFESACKDCSSGFFFNFQDWENYYIVDLETDGDISVYAFYNNKWIKVSDTVRAQNYNSAGMNKITVINKGNNFEIRINDIPATQFTDDRFHGGTVGLRAEGSKGTKNIVYFDNLEVRKINPEDFQMDIEIEPNQAIETSESSDLIYRQDFSVGNQDWPLDSNYNDWGTIIRYISDQKYQWRLNFIKQKMVVVQPNIVIKLPEDGYQISIDTHFNPACVDCCSGILFNIQNMENFYYISLCTDGKTKAYFCKNNNRTLLADIVQSDYFNPVDMNKITIVNDDDNYEIQINDIPLINFKDNRFRTGTIGLIAEGPAETQTTVFFDNLEVKRKN